MSLQRLRQQLEERDGMRFDELAEHRLRRALEESGAAGGSDDAKACAVLDDPALHAALIDRVTLQETSFFRDPKVWADLETTVLPAAIRAAAGGPLVVWSAGCANGQEAWSLAMLLSELGAPRYEVVATDVSEAAVARTLAGRYGERELRGLAAARRDRFLVPVAGGWEVGASLRRHLRAHRQNAATDTPMVADRSCSVVLCRYLMIYLTPAAADQLLERIASALAPDGRLLIGAAESLWHLSERFTAEALRTPSPTGSAAPRTPRHDRAAPAPSPRVLSGSRVAGGCASARTTGSDR
jgi:chemotaxis protein methyltransferase CheR